MISSEYWSASKENERNVVKNCTVVITTIMNASNLSRYFKEKEFDLFVIDEAGHQVSTCWF